jgi:A/G-specific adenine glycosylase
MIKDKPQNSTVSDFSSRLIAWQKIHGRHDLPWQNTQDPYAIWVSEIMLQQTQVAAVIAYYARFMARFPNIATLAQASQEEVLQHWSGLGYYSRARNLHNAAQTIMDEFDGEFPEDFEKIQTLSGIGRSTAAAIASFAFQQNQTILDGNVKRVLARHFLIEGWTGSPKIEKALWALAETLVPDQEMIAYTQGLMDLGATICTRSKPKCELCPLNVHCMALAKNQTKALPTPKPRKAIPQKQTTMLLLLNGNEVMLEKRPPNGIWGGLWSLPEISMQEIPSEVAMQRFGLEVESDEPLPSILHTFTHFKLEILPQPLQVIHRSLQAIRPNTIWLNIEDAIGAALPTPVRNILLNLQR